MNEIQKVSVKSLLSQDNVKSRFHDILKENANGFCANLAIMVNNNKMLAQCEPMSIISAAVIAASLNLPLDPNLGFSAIVPYKAKNAKGEYCDVAQFQVMYKGFVQLAMRTGQYKTIGVTEIYEGQLISENPLKSEYEFDFTIKSDKLIGVAAYFKLVNGFEKTIYWPIEKIDKHGKRFSKVYQKGSGLWKDDFESMAKKTVLKHLVSKWGILSIEMQKAVISDQGVVSGLTEDAEITYVDNEDHELAEIPLKRNDESKL